MKLKRGKHDKDNMNAMKSALEIEKYNLSMKDDKGVGKEALRGLKKE